MLYRDDLVPDFVWAPLSMLTGPTNFPLWFLRALFLTYILYYGFQRMSKSWPERYRLLAVVAITAASLIVYEIKQYRTSSYIVQLLFSKNLLIHTAQQRIDFHHYCCAHARCHLGVQECFSIFHCPERSFLYWWCRQTQMGSEVQIICGLTSFLIRQRFMSDNT